MFAVVVRLAYMLNLHRDGHGLQHTPFEAEMRRRLWWQIVLLDMRASEDVSSLFSVFFFKKKLRRHYSFQ